MIKTANVSKYNQIRLPDTFKPAIQDTNKGSTESNIHFGTNLDIIVIVAKHKQLSRDDNDRIRILVGCK